MADFETIRDQSMERLQKLKANIHVWKILEYIDNLRKKWKPKTRISEFEVYHGSQKGDIKLITQYWDEYRCVWTDREAAFKGYVFKSVSEIIYYNEV